MKTAAAATMRRSSPSSWPTRRKRKNAKNCPLSPLHQGAASSFPYMHELASYSLSRGGGDDSSMENYPR